METTFSKMENGAGISLGSPILDLELNADGSAAVGGTNITVSPIRSTNPSVTIQTEISQLPLKGPFLELVRNLEQGLGYRLDRTKTSHENENLFVFTYDWRKAIVRLQRVLQHLLNLFSFQNRFL